MLEIQNDQSEFTVFINGMPRIEFIPQEQFDLILAELITVFERQIGDKAEM